MNKKVVKAESSKQSTYQEPKKSITQQPNIGYISAVEDVKKEYTNPGIIKNIQKLYEQYPIFRQVKRGDCNSFFRCFFFGYMEQILGPLSYYYKKQWKEQITALQENQININICRTNTIPQEFLDSYTQLSLHLFIELNKILTGEMYLELQANTLDQGDQLIQKQQRSKLYAYLADELENLMNRDPLFEFAGVMLIRAYCLQALKQLSSNQKYQQHFLGNEINDIQSYNISINKLTIQALCEFLKVQIRIQSIYKNNIPIGTLYQPQLKQKYQNRSQYIEINLLKKQEQFTLIYDSLTANLIYKIPIPQKMNNIIQQSKIYASGLNKSLHKSIQSQKKEQQNDFHEINKQKLKQQLDIKLGEVIQEQTIVSKPEQRTGQKKFISLCLDEKQQLTFDSAYLQAQSFPHKHFFNQPADSSRKKLSNSSTENEKSNNPHSPPSSNVATPLKASSLSKNQLNKSAYAFNNSDKSMGTIFEKSNDFTCKICQSSIQCTINGILICFECITSIFQKTFKVFLEKKAEKSQIKKNNDKIMQQEKLASIVEKQLNKCVICQHSIANNNISAVQGIDQECFLKYFQQIEIKLSLKKNGVLSELEQNNQINFLKPYNHLNQLFQNQIHITQPQTRCNVCLIQLKSIGFFVDGCNTHIFCESCYQLYVVNNIFSSNIKCLCKI